MVKNVEPGGRKWNKLGAKERLRRLEDLNAAGKLKKTSLIKELDKLRSRYPQNEQLPVAKTNGTRVVNRRVLEGLAQVRRTAASQSSSGPLKINTENLILKKELLAELIAKVDSSASLPAPGTKTQSLAGKTNKEFLEDLDRLTAAVNQNVSGGNLQIDYVSPNFDKSRRLALVLADWHDDGSANLGGGQALVSLANLDFVFRLYKENPSDFFIMEGSSLYIKPELAKILKTKSHKQLYSDMNISPQLIFKILLEENTKIIMASTTTQSLGLKEIANSLTNTMMFGQTDEVNALLGQIATMYHPQMPEEGGLKEVRQKLYEHYLASLAKELGCELTYVGNGRVQLPVPLIKEANPHAMRELIGRKAKLDRQRDTGIAELSSRYILENSHSLILIGGEHRERFYGELEKKGISVVGLRSFDFALKPEDYFIAKEEVKAIRENYSETANDLITYIREIAAECAQADPLSSARLPSLITKVLYDALLDNESSVKLNPDLVKFYNNCVSRLTLGLRKKGITKAGIKFIPVTLAEGQFNIMLPDFSSCEPEEWELVKMHFNS